MGWAVELRQLRYFVTVAEELHFGRAAERLDIVQPAVSQQVSRLERELGVRLLVRTSRRVVLTSDGTRLLTEAKAALAAVDRVTTVAAALAAGRSATLRLGTSAGTGDRVRRGIAALRATTPDLGIELVSGTTTELVSAVRSGALDLALVRGAAPRTGLRVVELWREPLVAILPADHPASAAPAVSVAALADLPLRLPRHDTDPGLHNAVIDAFRAAGVTPTLGRPVTSAEATTVEIGVGEPAWMVAYGCTPTGDTVARPFTPALTLPGQLVVPGCGAPGCFEAVVTAFG